MNTLASLEHIRPCLRNTCKQESKKRSSKNKQETKLVKLIMEEGIILGCSENQVVTDQYLSMKSRVGHENASLFVELFSALNILENKESFSLRV